MQCACVMWHAFYLFLSLTMFFALFSLAVVFVLHALASLFLLLVELRRDFNTSLVLSLVQLWRLTSLYARVCARE